MNQLCYGDNLEVLQKYIGEETIDLCYIDPPFNSKRDYNQIYNNIGTEDKAQVQAFVDTWDWDDAAIEGFEKFDLASGDSRYSEKTKLLINALEKVLGRGSMLAYIVSLTQRIVEIYRVLKPTGSFYLHCDPTASHYLKLILDSVFCSKGGEYRNEIIWCYRKWTNKSNGFQHNHDVIFLYTKSKQFTFNKLENEPFKENYYQRGYSTNTIKSKNGTYSQLIVYDREKAKHLIDCGKYDKVVYREETTGVAMPDWWEISIINSQAKERLGYPTQKPEKLLERIILASTKEGDKVLDSYCGCGTTVAVAQRLKRKWVGIDITYQSISLILKRLEESYGKKIINNIDVSGIPKDMASVKALIEKDPLRKEYEIWAIMTYSNNRAIPNEKKGADRGIDGKMYITTSLSPKEQKPILFSVKSGHVSVAQIRDFIHVIDREKAAAGVFITYEEPTKPMIKEAKEAGTFLNPLTGKPIEKLQIVTISNILDGERENFPNVTEVLKRAERKTDNFAELEGLDDL
ncbi:MAG: restriction endonuclease [Bacteroidales bacterium]|jgi:site-specific DNA-methyltransferase (adenine-specific)|nr:restriction endonuclease [Bacteroidales bacterium]